MQQAEATLATLDVQVRVVTFEPAPAARAYVAETGIRWPVLIDETRALYAAYGLGRARWRHLVGPRTIWAYTREAWRGRWPRWPVADTVQQGGDVLIDPGGIVRYVHVGTGPGDRPPVERVIAEREGGAFTTGC